MRSFGAMWKVPRRQSTSQTSGEYSLVPGFTASKILWLKNKEPENFARLRKVLLPHDFLNYHLTGRYCMEVRSGKAPAPMPSRALQPSEASQAYHSSRAERK